MSETPSNVRNIANFALAIALFLLAYGLVLALIGEYISEMGSYSAYYSGRYIRLNGIFVILIGAAAITISWGLSQMKEWARLWGIQFFKALFFFSLISFISNFMVIVCSSVSLIVALLSLLFWTRLNSSQMKTTFEYGQYEPPDWTGQSMMKSRSYVEKRTMEPQPAEEDVVNVPDSMMLCPDCNTLNKKLNKNCRKCGLEFR